MFKTRNKHNPVYIKKERKNNSLITTKQKTHNHKTINIIQELKKITLKQNNNDKKCVCLLQAT